MDITINTVLVLKYLNFSINYLNFNVNDPAF